MYKRGREGGPLQFCRGPLGAPNGGRVLLLDKGSVNLREQITVRPVCGTFSAAKALV